MRMTIPKNRQISGIGPRPLINCYARHCSKSDGVSDKDFDAEPGALVGFAGPRTIAETIKVELPDGFQTAEFMLEHGFIDMIVPRQDLRSEIARIIDYCQK
jgi:hypothetical protein